MHDASPIRGSPHCEKSYVGETGRSFTVRMKEHRRAVKNKDIKNANAAHSVKKRATVLTGRMPESLTGSRTGRGGHTHTHTHTHTH